MRIINGILLCCSALVSYITSVEAQNQVAQQKSTAKINKMDAQVSELMAERVDIRKTLELKELAKLNEEQMVARENLQFPADELYGSHWNNQWVDPFAGHARVDLPDSYDIDCSSFVYPIAIDSVARITSKYGPRRRRMHKGIDLKVLVGDTIVAAFDGKIRIKNFERRGYGYYVVIRHPNGLETVYGHLSKILVDENQIVRAGQPIGLGGDTGRSTGSHLHFETRFLGQALNPADLIDFEVGAPIQDTYTFRKVKVHGRSSNIYTASTNGLVYHRVKQGDTLGKIARMYGTTVKRLCQLNNISENATLRLGQSLRCGGGSETATNKSSAASVNQQPKTIKVEADAASVSAMNTSKTSTPANSAAVYYRVKQGDTLGKIASKNGTTVKKLCELNGITEKTTLRIGRSLRCS
jgi:murein DD-endopeptidase MepM/ murein hydrolase activator NlpD